MNDSPVLWMWASRMPWALPASLLHHWALAATHAERFDLALPLFESAALRYRESLSVEELARLRTHELICKYRSGAFRSEGDSVALEIERRLERLTTIEALDPPFARVSARQLLATWPASQPTPRPRPARTPTALESAA